MSYVEAMGCSLFQPSMAQTCTDDFCSPRSVEHAHCMAYLLSKGADPSTVNSMGDNALHVAARNASAACIQKMMTSPTRVKSVPASCLADVVCEDSITKFVDLPNGELACTGQGLFKPVGCSKPVACFPRVWACVGVTAGRGRACLNTHLQAMFLSAGRSPPVPGNMTPLRPVPCLRCGASAGSGCRHWPCSCISVGLHASSRMEGLLPPSLCSSHPAIPRTAQQRDQVQKGTFGLYCPLVLPKQEHQALPGLEAGGNVGAGAQMPG